MSGNAARSLEYFKEHLTKKPYCTNWLEDGLRIRTVEHAVLMRYIQPNHPNCVNTLWFDVDHALGPIGVVHDLLMCPPHLVTVSPDTGKSHMGFHVMNGIHYNEHSSKSAIRYAGVVYNGIRDKLDADPAYTGLICKNPFHPDWKIWASNHPAYSLDELAEYIDLSPYSDKRKLLPECGLGRNNNLFERARRWSYKAIRQGWPDWKAWLKACEDRALMLNVQYAPDVPNADKGSLEHREVLAVAKSVAGWTYRHFSPEGFRAWQVEQGRKRAERGDMAIIGAKGGAVSRGGGRPSQKDALLVKALELRAQGYTQQGIASSLGIGLRTVKRWLADF